MILIKFWRELLIVILVLTFAGYVKYCSKQPGVLPGLLTKQPPIPTVEEKSTNKVREDKKVTEIITKPDGTKIETKTEVITKMFTRTEVVIEPKKKWSLYLGMYTPPDKFVAKKYEAVVNRRILDSSVLLGLGLNTNNECIFRIGIEF